MCVTPHRDGFHSEPFQSGISGKRGSRQSPLPGLVGKNAAKGKAIGRWTIVLTNEPNKEYKVCNSVKEDPMLYGHAAEVAIRAGLYLAGRPPGELSAVHEVAKAAKLPSPYLSKVIQRLAQAGLVRTFRGPGGGIELGKSPEAITLWSLVCATDGPADVNRCALGIGKCSPANPCPLHGRWGPLRDEFQKLLEGTTLATLLRELADTQAKHGSVGRRVSGRSSTSPTLGPGPEREVRR